MVLGGIWQDDRAREGMRQAKRVADLVSDRPRQVAALPYRQAVLRVAVRIAPVQVDVAGPFAERDAVRRP
ncbi:hypothetical protein CHU95_03515 [Niveispirillum lacus]|uniref:Uncharacterized protein n=1 Tax=Niveispirillum lacus TaxID=1981099 RepID=A0A255Z5X8_9PROT|nr:hypothetical protein CHU95_03515 [Niveispirillum lacus]